MRMQGVRGQAGHVEPGEELDGTAVAERREELDRALLTAVEHTQDAQQALVEEPPGTPRSVELADGVEHGAEDVTVLATEAREVTDAEAAAPEPDGRR
jgi:hypothetical protein